MRPVQLTGFVAVAVACILSAGAGRAQAITYAPPDTPGPALDVAPATLQAALQCSATGVIKPLRAPVLLVQATGASAKDNWSWTYEPALNKLGVGWCTIDLPNHATSDVQTAGEYVVFAIRRMYQLAGRRIAIIGHSQGGVVPRWALRFWPDTRSMVDDLIGFAPDNHGTIIGPAACADGCPPAYWQNSSNSKFVAALNEPVETWKGISYTNVYTHTDENVIPNQNASGSSSLHTGEGMISNVATQDICTADVYEHFAIGLIDPVAYALAIDALTHNGPADPARIPTSVCSQVLQPGINSATFAEDFATALADYTGYEPYAQGHPVSAEPPLACYVTATCPRRAHVITSGAQPQSCLHQRRLMARVPQLRDVKAFIGTRRLRPRRFRGHETVGFDLRHIAHGYAVRIRFTGRDSRGREVRMTRTYRVCSRL